MATIVKRGNSYQFKAYGVDIYAAMPENYDLDTTI